MLFDVAALSTSVAISPVAEAFGVHEISQSISPYVTPADPLILGSNTGSSGLSIAINADQGTSLLDLAPAAVDPASLSTLRGTALLEQFTILPSTDVAAFVKSHPEALEKMLAQPPAATSVAGLWTGLTATQQQSLLATAPGYIGNLDGVPFTVRDTANRVYLAQSISQLKSTIKKGVGRADLVETRHHLDILEQVSRTLKTKKGQPVRQLVTFDPSGEGRAAVSVGDLSTADYVSYLVPGMFFTVQGQMYDWTVIAQDLQSEQTTWLARLAKTDPTKVGKTAATVSWIGYKTPGILDIGSLTLANEGADLLGSAINGVDATRVGSEPYVSLITHSYGSTAAMIELAKGGVSVDALAIVGSPGGATQKASALSVKNDNVFVGEAAWDPVVNTAFYGSDPGSPSFGARKMSVSGGTDVITHKPLAAAIGHLGYFDAGTEAMRNLALVGLGEGALVTDGTTADASRTLSSK